MNAKGELITAIRTTGSAITHTEVLNVVVRNLDLKAMESSVKVNTSKTNKTKAHKLKFDSYKPAPLNIKLYCIKCTLIIIMKVLNCLSSQT